MRISKLEEAEMQACHLMLLCFVIFASHVSLSSGVVIKRCLDANSFAFTIDDGPLSDYLPLAMKVLRKRQMPATFYLVGLHALNNPELVRQLDKDPLFMVAGHSYAHKNLHEMETEQEVLDEIYNGFDVLEDITGRRFRHFRPPFGAFDRFDILTGPSQLSVDMWSIDINDWKVNSEVAKLELDEKTSAELVAQETIRKLKAELEKDDGSQRGHIYLSHDRRLVFLALDKVIEFLQSYENLKFVKMDECSGIPETFDLS